MKKSILLLLLAVLSLSACSKRKSHAIKIATISGPETALMEVAQQVAAKKFRVHFKIVTFSDYNLPNQALDEKAVNINMFQHLPYLHAQIKARQYHFAVIGKAFLYPMGIYSKKVTQLSALQPGAKVALPNDPSNEARALLLLQKAGLIHLKPHAGVNATVLDIEKNPKQLQFVELDSAQLPRSLEDVDLAVINTTFAIPAGLSPTKDALFVEDKDSPYVNVFVVRAEDRNNPRLQKLVKAFQSDAVKAKANALFGEGAVAGW